MQAWSSTRRGVARAVTAISVVLMCLPGAAFAADDLADMSLEDLMNLTVTSASKREQSKVDAAAAITVLTNEDIRRSGATSVPEVLRFVPGLNVARIDASRWAITARGYNGQFANKLLMLIDGRSVYSPLFGGVYWDSQDLILEDVERIEVIRGPGGTLWGANAVNGVINITTKKAKDTQGVYAAGLAGNQEYVGEGRFGGMIGEDTAYRAYARGFKRDDFTLPSGALGAPAHDGWWQWRVGGRVDSQLTDDDLVTLQGDFYDGRNEATAYDLLAGTINEEEDAEILGGNVLARWNHALSERQSLEVQAYWDRTERDAETSSEVRDTVDVLVQHDFMLGAENQWLFNWGLESFWTRDDTTPGPGTAFVPNSRDFYRFSGFAQAQWNLLGGDVQITGGTKLEYNSYTDFEYQPTGRVLWKFIDGNAVWAAGSRAVRSPTRVDRDIAFGVLVTGNPDIESENLIAAEAGYRNYMMENVTVDLTAFYNKYKDYIGLSGGTFVNGGESEAWGTEVEVAWVPIDDLRFVTTYAYLQIRDQLTGATPIFGANDGASPQHTWMLRGLWNVPVVPVELDAAVWYVAELDARIDPATLPPGPGSTTVPSYWRLDLRAAWQALDWLALEVVGQNLTEESHVEWGEGVIPLFPGTYVPRSYYGKVVLTF